MNGNEMHEANRKRWDTQALEWRELREIDGDWRRCPQEPEIAFEGAAFEFINRFAGTLAGKQVCVIGSGDNYAAFALAGMGADVTSTDISEQQLATAAERAETLGLKNIRFVRCDGADLSPIDSGRYDLVCSTNGFFVWIADLPAVFSSVYRVLKPGGLYVFYDIHPFQRPWKEPHDTVMGRSYYKTGPFVYQELDQDEYNFHWTMSDILNSLMESSLNIRRIAESPAVNARFWEDFSYGEGKDPTLQDWNVNPRAGLPVWLTVAAQKLTD